MGRGGVGGRLGLQLAYGLDEGLGPRAVAHAPAGHAVGLGQTLTPTAPLGGPGSPPTSRSHDLIRPHSSVTPKPSGTHLIRRAWRPYRYIHPTPPSESNMLGLLHPVIPFGTPSIFWTKTLYHLDTAMDDRASKELLHTINTAMQGMGPKDTLGHPQVDIFGPDALTLGETRVFKTDFLLDPSRLNTGKTHNSIPLTLIVQVSISLDFSQWTFILDLGKDDQTACRYTRFGAIDVVQPSSPNWRTDFLAAIHRVSSVHEHALGLTPVANDQLL